MSLLAGDQVRFTLLDTHRDSIESAKRIVGSLGFYDRVDRFEIDDACRFRLGEGVEPDIIVIEMLRAALESEPQVAVAMNLTSQAKAALRVAEGIEIDLALVDQRAEF